MLEVGFEPRYPASETTLQLFPGPSIQQILVDHLLYDRSVIGTEDTNKIDRVLFQRRVRLAFSLPERFGSEETFFNEDDAPDFPGVTPSVSIPPLTGPGARLLATAM